MKKTKEKCCLGGCGDINCEHCGLKKLNNRMPGLMISQRQIILNLLKTEREKTINDFLSGRLCHSCGGPKKDNPLSDMCGKCWEEA